MISIVARFVVEKENEVEFLATAEKLVAASQAEEGCIRYELCKNRKVDNEYAVIEEWASDAAVLGHKESAHFKALVPGLKKIASAKSDHYTTVKF